MMTNLFSTFDPTTSSWSLNWLSLALPSILLPLTFWATPSRVSMAASMLQKKIHSEMKTLLGHTYSLGVSLALISIMWFIMINNLLGLIPYIFTATSHLVVTLAISLPLWLLLMIFGWMKNTNKMFMHLLPQGTPLVLMTFMILIETVSSMIRPLTLAVRLSANMVAGHLLLTLLGNQGDPLNLLSSTFVLFTQTFLLVLELAVALIQSYVFIILLGLYSSEVH